MGQATEIYSREFDRRFQPLPSGLKNRIICKIRLIGGRLDAFPHEKLQGREEFRIRVGDYRIIYDFNIHRNEILLITLGHRREVYR